MIQVIFRKTLCGRVIYFSKEIDVRANWDVEQVFDVSIPYFRTEKKTEKNSKGFRVMLAVLTSDFVEISNPKPLIANHNCFILISKSLKV
jgi:hypothetical protein